MATREEAENWLWEDPFGKDSRLISGAVLLAEDIKRYVLDYGVLINRQDFQAGEEYGAKLKGASYTMSPHPSKAYTFASTGEEKVPLKQDEDENGPYYVVPHHTLSYIKLRQKLRIPYYCIGRHNLKISYVYQGLLLGTGPQVDPGYVGNLYIPLHNLTTRDVRVYIKESFVSIDFVRTTPLEFNGPVPETLESLYKQYEASKHLIDPQKVNQRVELEDYLRGASPRSAMGAILAEYRSTKEGIEAFRKDIGNETTNLKDEQQRTLTAFQEKITRMQRIEAGAALLATVAVAGLVVAMISLARDFTGGVASQMDAIQGRTATMERDIGHLQGRSEEGRASTQLEARLKELEEQVKGLSAQLKSTRGDRTPGSKQ